MLVDSTLLSSNNRNEQPFFTANILQNKKKLCATSDLMTHLLLNNINDVYPATLIKNLTAPSFQKEMDAYVKQQEKSASSGFSFVPSSIKININKEEATVTGKLMEKDGKSCKNVYKLGFEQHQHCTLLSSFELISSTMLS